MDRTRIARHIQKRMGKQIGIGESHLAARRRGLDAGALHQLFHQRLNGGACGFQSPPRYLSWAKTNWIGRRALRPARRGTLPARAPRPRDSVREEAEEIASIHKIAARASFGQQGYNEKQQQGKREIILPAFFRENRSQ